MKLTDVFTITDFKDNKDPITNMKIDGKLIFKKLMSIVDTLTINYEKLEDELRMIESEHSDLVHEIILGRPKNAKGTFKLTKRMRKLGTRRYEIKEMLSLCSNAVEYVLDKKKMSTSELSKILTRTINQEKNMLANEYYTSNVRTDLTVNDYREERRALQNE